MTILITCALLTGVNVRKIYDHPWTMWSYSWVRERHSSRGYLIYVSYDLIESACMITFKNFSAWKKSTTINDASSNQILTKFKQISIWRCCCCCFCCRRLRRLRRFRCNRFVSFAYLDNCITAAFNSMIISKEDVNKNVTVSLEIKIIRERYVHAYVCVCMV